MTLVWGGTEAKLVPLRAEPVAPPALRVDARQRQKKRAATGGTSTAMTMRKKEAKTPLGRGC
jgi:hypothetical protein